MNSIDRKICYLAESLLIESEFLSWKLFSPPSIPDIKIAADCIIKQCDRTIPEKIITSSIVESHIGKNASTTYLVEILAAVSTAPYILGDKLAIVSSESINSCEQTFTLTICHYSDDSFVLLDMTF